MIRKIILPTMFAISLMGCDSDFRQGSCEEGFYEQSDGNGGFFCAPLNRDEGVDKPVPNIDNVNEVN